MLIGKDNFEIKKKLLLPCCCHVQPLVDEKGRQYIKAEGVWYFVSNSSFFFFTCSEMHGLYYYVLSEFKVN